jgi:hypothetical protein
VISKIEAKQEQQYKDFLELKENQETLQKTEKYVVK